MISEIYKFFAKRQFLTLGIVLVVEAVLCFVIIRRIAYTEIDWVAYMQEVEGFLGGELNYSNLRGDTGPLVYPAGFVYIFAALRWLTDEGLNIVKGQYIFALIYLAVLGAVVRLYQTGNRTPLWALIPLVLSKRIHSIFVLRMFNDCVAVMLGYFAIYLFTNRKWRVGCFFYSLAVSVKMNMLLYAPGVLLVLLMGTGLVETVVCLSICAGLQLLLGLPFLATFPIDYLKNSFDLGRVFMFKWTVNLKFLPEDVFTSKSLSLVLLALTVAAFLLFGWKWVTQSQTAVSRITGKKSNALVDGPWTLTPHFVIVTIFTSNFIGIVFARTLHYQFYCWYFHTLPYLLWHSSLPTIARVGVLIGVEFAFNVYPATPLSSAILQVCHFIILGALYMRRVPDPLDEKLFSNGKKN